MGCLYGLNRDICDGNDIGDIAVNHEENEKKEIPAISGISLKEIAAISENALISALRRRLTRQDARIELRLGC